MKTFEELGCYQAARAFRNNVSSFCKSLPREETYRLKDQFVRASPSITANIAEGYGRHHHQENLQFCRQARGSLSECLDHLNVALDESYITNDQYSQMRNEATNLHKILNGYIAYLNRCVQHGVPATS